MNIEKIALENELTVLLYLQKAHEKYPAAKLCPNSLAARANITWSCLHCIGLFINYPKQYHQLTNGQSIRCPCHALGDIAYIRVTARINEIKQQLKKF